MADAFFIHLATKDEIETRSPIQMGEKDKLLFFINNHTKAL